MNQWSFVTAAYMVTALGTGIVLAHSWWTMRRAERAAGELRRR